MRGRWEANEREMGGGGERGWESQEYGLMWEGDEGGEGKMTAVLIQLTYE